MNTFSHVYPKTKCQDTSASCSLYLTTETDKGGETQPEVDSGHFTRRLSRLEHQISHFLGLLLQSPFTI